jgi:hypothetical protein
MQKQLAAQESILTFAQIAPLAVLVIFTLIILIAIGIATVYLVRVIKNTGVGSTSVPQGGRSWLEYGSFLLWFSASLQLSSGSSVFCSFSVALTM